MMPNVAPHGTATLDACKDARELQYLQQNQECLRFLAENSRDLVIEVTGDGKILSVSPNVKAVLGLGLPVVHGIVREHRGAITVRSQPGIGTTFDVYLPALECAPPESKDSAQPLLHGKGEHILLVDDEPSVCAALCLLLMRLGYRVTAETSPVNALKTFAESPDEFDLLISDLTMPHMTGVDLARQILQVRPQLPVLLASGSSGDLTANEMRQFGVCDLLPKPISLPALADLVHKSLRGNQSR
jgi:CheY-like chemotaxis protein